MMTSATARALVLSLAVAGGCSPATPEQRFRSALQQGDADKIASSLADGQRVDHRFDGGLTPLHALADGRGGAEATALLLGGGADPNAVDDDGQTPWDTKWKRPGGLFATDIEFLVTLLDAGVEPAAPIDERGRTLLHHAAERADSSRLVALLVQRRDFPVDIRDLFGWTALHVAAFEDHADSAIGLLENGADVNAETTAIAGKQRGADHPPSWLWKVDPGSRPLDTHRPPLRSGSAKNTAAILRQYGATENPAVDNTLR